MSTTVFRPVAATDLADLLALTAHVGHGMTNLPGEPAALRDKIELSLYSWQQDASNQELMNYFFVLEHVATQKVIGCSAIIYTGNKELPFYHFKMVKLTHCSPELQYARTHQILIMVNDYQGVTEIGSLLLHPNFLGSKNGLLLSLARFLFIAQHPKYFSDIIIAEMRGVIDEAGTAPFWHAIAGKFMNINFLMADHLTSRGHRQFIADLMPRYPIYVDYLPAAALAVLGKVHIATMPALKVLHREGFKQHNYFNIFDGGPAIECYQTQIKTIRASNVLPVKVVPHLADAAIPVLISNTQKDFRATMSATVILDSIALVDNETATLLNVTSGDNVRIRAL